jgi:hypothetical protein
VEQPGQGGRACPFGEGVGPVGQFGGRPADGRVVDEDEVGQARGDDGLGELETPSGG